MQEAAKLFVCGIYATWPYQRGAGPRASPLRNADCGRNYFPAQLRRVHEGDRPRAQIVDLHFHDIRGTTVTMLAEAGCTLPVIVSINGHTLRRAQDILDKYLARTSELAESAIAKFENVMETESAKRLAK
jgi:hypothetical protein